MLLSVLDHHTRRQEGAGRVIGTLLGKRDGDRVSSIIFSFCSKVAKSIKQHRACVLSIPSCTSSPCAFLFFKLPSSNFPFIVFHRSK